MFREVNSRIEDYERFLSLFSFLLQLGLRLFLPRFSLHIYIGRVNEFNKVAKSPLEEWVNYLKNGVINPDTKVPGLQEAREKLKYYEMSDAERHAYDEHINAIMIQNDVLGNARLEGHAEGKAEGRYRKV